MDCALRDQLNKQQQEGHPFAQSNPTRPQLEVGDMVTARVEIAAVCTVRNVRTVVLAVLSQVPHHSSPELLKALDMQPLTAERTGDQAIAESDDD